MLLAAICLTIFLIAIVGPYLAPYSPEDADILSAGLGPSGAHWLGTDALGRDILSRLLVGARLSIAGASLIVALSTLFGVSIALACAWRGGILDSIMMSALNIVFAIPGLLIAVILSALMGAGFWPPVIALTVVYVPFIARVIRSAALRERRRAYVDACQIAGFSSWRINLRHIAPNIGSIILAQATITFGAALMDFGAISFLGLGIQPPQAEWGLMVAEGRSELLEGSYQLSMSAGLMIIITVIVFNVLGERISDRYGRA
ncbi:ABC transporter permease [Mesorhizobium intechi]|nr:ABC transporter permease [Mesorhizobium intechi]